MAFIDFITDTERHSSYLHTSLFIASPAGYITISRNTSFSRVIFLFLWTMIYTEEDTMNSDNYENLKYYTN